MEIGRQTPKIIPPLCLGRFHISEDYGFLLPNPLKELPDHYRPWMEIASNLPQLIQSHQLHAHVNQMPLLDVQFLQGYKEQRLAHLVLSAIAMGYVWQEGETQPKETPGNQALAQAVNALLQSNQDDLLHALQRLRLSIQGITRVLGQMHDYVDPDIFYAVIRIFLSGWQDNPAMPSGLIYEGVSSSPLKYSGGSAAQSSVLHALDEFLGIQHSKESAAFLYRMRDYMPPSHKAFIEEISSVPSLRELAENSGPGQCLTSYNQCVEALAELRSYHIAMVTRYLIIAASKARSQRPNHLPGPPKALEARGTGGTSVLSFLKSVRDKTLAAILKPSGAMQSPP
ncbi:indoleamine 2,3-dioxygenase 2 isoform X4 [Perognathus longimembris pacificus]|uniref:indoleamine 2,3-dioxygenase 2 isoform X4 n=1 Tax=Perognathus longimembris pacificus TaxID=214514 RepID=UPI002018D8AD|nr:indoleamine 2,3-dioxygenase 2 isoform X4 [Perognathus longimembris pacificus]